jgi:hypothetical protein
MAQAYTQSKQENQRLIKEWLFDQPAVNLGSHPDNDIVLEGAGIQPFHVVLLLHDVEFRIIPLTTEAVIHLDDHPFTDTVIPFDDDQEIEIGDYRLRVHQGETDNKFHVTVSQPVQDVQSEPVLIPEVNELTQPLHSLDMDSLSAVPEFSSNVLAEKTEDMPGLAVKDHIQDSLQVTLISQFDEIDVEQTALFIFEVVNIGMIVEHFNITVRGVPNIWVQINPLKLQLLSGQRSNLQISITPPRLSTSRAGKHPFELIFTSPNYPGQQFTVNKELTIHPYYRFTVNNLQPQRQSIRWPRHNAMTRLPISNQGNSDADFTLSALDEENACLFNFLAPNGAKLHRQAVINIPAGESINQPIEVSPRKQPLVALTSRRYMYSTTIQVADQTALSQMLSGTATYHPLFGRLSIFLIILALLVGCFYMLQPRIYSFQVAASKDVIELGDTTKLEWNVSPFASMVNISNVEQPINRGQSSLTIAPDQSTSYSLTAGNWLSELFRLGYKMTQTILVIPPSPRINVFEVDQTSVAKGKPVNLRWSVVKADQVFLTIDEVVYELGKEEFSGERQVVLEKDALVILEARNASGSELRSYFINVVPPAISVQTFAVWVRPAEQAAYQAGSAKLASLKYAPDSNFPEKFVELVPDSTSDIGYRVEFYQPDRELQKGEQVIVEWSVIGTDNGKLQIAPFEDALPSKGSQPFFPQESMNFVMTAKSGELEQLFMLPVKVFDGEPPQPPKIEFFKASPTKMVGAGNVQFAWSVSGEWTRVQIASGEQVIADYLNPQGFKTVVVSTSATFILTAWNGNLSSAAPVEVTVDPALIPLTLQIKSVYPETGRFLIGDKIAVTVEFTDVPEDKPEPTGKIIVTDGFSNCPITLPAVTCDLTFNTPGLKSITASYEGDKIYLQADSDPYSGTITVASLTVNLNPAYYYLDSAGTGPGALIDELANTPLKLDQGLYIKVNVQPVNTVLADDKKGKITLSVCEQELKNGAPVAKIGTCVFVGTATVAQSTVDDEFYADLVLKNFSWAGTQVLLFEYRHDDNAISPVSLTQTDVKVLEMGIYLSLPICKTNPDTFLGCEVGVTDPSKAKITFDIKKGENKTLLSSILPKPNASAFKVFDYSIAPQNNWTCTVIVKNSTYKLDCTANFTGLVNVDWYYTFTDASDRNYSFASGNNGTAFPYKLKVLQTTSLVLIIPTTVKAGEPIRLSGPVSSERTIEIRDSLGNPISPAGGLKLTDNNPANIGAYAIASGSNCSMDSTTGDISIPSITASCVIYFKVVGSYPLTVTYLGDNNNYATSSSSTQVGVVPQTSFSAVWKYDDGNGYKDWGTLSSWLEKTNLPIRIAFTNSTGFLAESLAGMKLNVTIKNGGIPITSADCTSPVVTDGVHQATIGRNAVTNEVYADFTLYCVKSPNRLTLDLALADPSNFSFSSPESRQLLIVPTSGGGYWYGFDMSVNIVRDPNGQSMLVADPSDRWTQLYIGETYSLTLVLETIFDYFDTWYDPTGPQNLAALVALYNNKKVMLDLPDYLAARVDAVNSTCPASTDPNYDIEIPLQTTLVEGYEFPFYIGPGVTYYWGYALIKLANNTPCTLVFTPGNSSTSTDAAAFYFSTPSNFLGDYHASISYGTSGLRRQNVTLHPLTFSGYAGMTQTIVFNLDREIPTNPLAPLDTTEDFTSNFALTLPGNCAVTRNTGLDQINLITQAQFGLNLPSAACAAIITLTYNGNDYFNDLTQNITVTVNLHNADISPLTYPQGSNQNPFPAANIKVNDDFELRTTVSDADGLSHTQIPSGSVEVYLGDGVGVPLAASNYEVTQVTGGGAVNWVTDRYTIALINGEAVFNIKFLAAVTGAKLWYKYPGDTLFKATAQQSTAAFDVTSPPPPP